MKLKLYRKIAVATIAVVVMFSLILIGVILASHVGDSGDQMESIVVAVPPLEQNGLLYVAQNQGFFASNGLEVTINDYDSGVTSINGILNGEAQIAEAAEFPFVNAVMRNKTISVIACNDKFENDYLVCLRNQGINDIPELKGKTIGLTRGTIVEFYFGRFLELHGMTFGDVELVDVKPEQFLKIMTDGDIDALVAWQPYVNQIQGKVEGVVWPVQNSQAVYGIFVCNNDWLNHHGETVKCFLKSLKQAEDFVVYHSGTAETIIQERLNYTYSYIQNVWPKHSFSLSLDQTLIVAMKDEAQWLISNRFVESSRLPDFSNNIFTDGLLAVKPESVSIIK